jgi:hypothetical protein
VQHLGKSRGRQSNRARRHTGLARPLTNPPVNRIQANAKQLRRFATRHQPLRLTKQLATAMRELAS